MDNKTFSLLLQKYAHLIVKTGINVKKRQQIVLLISVNQTELAHFITKEAYKLGADEVIVQWIDEYIQREFLLHAKEDYLSTTPEYKIKQINEWVEQGMSRISVVSADPDALVSVPSSRIAMYQAASGNALKPLRKVTQANKISWTVVAAASPEWAAKVFPTISSSEEQVRLLWDQIFKTTNIYAENPVQAWHEHAAYLSSKAEQLNKEQFNVLHYTAPGTNLRIGLPKNHLWEGAGSKNSRGESFIANMPTEEVFTAPDYRNVNGYVRSTKPLSYAGTIISGMHFTFEEGKVVAFSADYGEETLKHLLNTDEGARYLGEVALVPDPSPISQSGLVFYNTLFDENASNHLALGSAYAFNLAGGTKLNEQELRQAGLNRSNIHVDFMIGSDQLSIDGIKEDGQRIPIFRNGDWA